MTAINVTVSVRIIKSILPENVHLYHYYYVFICYEGVFPEGLGLHHRRIRDFRVSLKGYNV